MMCQTLPKSSVLDLRTAITFFGKVTHSTAQHRACHIFGLEDALAVSLSSVASPSLISEA